MTGTLSEMKRRARKSIKRHYRLFLVICLAAALLGSEFTDSAALIKGQNNETMTERTVNAVFYGEPEVDQEMRPGNHGLADVLRNIAADNLAASDEISRQQMIEDAEKYRDGMMARSNGTLAQLINNITSGHILVRLAEMIHNVFVSSQVTLIILIAISFSLVFLWWMLIQNIYQVILRRIFLEGRTYEKVPVQRIFFLRGVKKWCKASVAMMVATIFQYLWFLTIIGGVIKFYSYFLVPYILAENPDLSPRQAINLSRRMMNGHKWECFLYELTFIGWNALNLFTLGLSGIFFSNAYQAGTFCEYYVRLRQEAIAKGIPDADLLNDRYLYETADADILAKTYPEASYQPPKHAEHQPRRYSLRWIMGEIFGITLYYDNSEHQYQREQAAAVLAKRCRFAHDGQTYPVRLSPLPLRSSKNLLVSTHYIRHYSVCSLILLFFIFSFIGWLWEVALHLVEDGVFVNRGTMYGPWLPIYGIGGVVILTVLNKLRSRPTLEFFAAIVLCGILEYTTSFLLETFMGQHWWDYSGYFLNLNGRVCAEGLLIFGLGGMAIVYLLAPRLDNCLRRLGFRRALTICVILSAAFLGDLVYSVQNPNTGEGITTQASRDFAQTVSVSAVVSQSDFLVSPAAPPKGAAPS